MAADRRLARARWPFLILLVPVRQATGTHSTGCVRLLPLRQAMGGVLYRTFSASFRCGKQSDALYRTRSRVGSGAASKAMRCTGRALGLVPVRRQNRGRLSGGVPWWH